jgi:hypothetical protein
LKEHREREACKYVDDNVASFIKQMQLKPAFLTRRRILSFFSALPHNRTSAVLAGVRAEVAFKMCPLPLALGPIVARATGRGRRVLEVPCNT